MHHDAGHPPANLERYGDVQLDPIREGDNLPKGAGGYVAKQRVGPARQHCCEPSPVASDLRTADGVYASIHRVEAPRGKPMGDYLRAESESQQLRARNDAVLTGDEVTR